MLLYPHTIPKNTIISISTRLCFLHLSIRSSFIASNVSGNVIPSTRRPVYHNFCFFKYPCLRKFYNAESLGGGQGCTIFNTSFVRLTPAETSPGLQLLPASYENCTERTVFNPSFPYGKHRVPGIELPWPLSTRTKFRLRGRFFLCAGWANAKTLRVRHLVRCRFYTPTMGEK